jgi:hypothetical protein
MDLQKLRPTYSQWRAPLGPAPEGRARPTPPVAVAKPALAPPKGKGNELWQKFYNDAVAAKSPWPEKLADTLLRSRERALELQAKRHTTQVTLEPPKPQEAAVANKGKAAKGRPVVHEALRCKARTLAGKQCGFKATCGEFCKKHAVADAEVPVVKWHRVRDPCVFKGTSLKGYLNFSQAAVKKVFGEPTTTVRDGHTVPQWLVRFEDETLAALYYYHDDPALHVGGASTAAIAKVREALS